MKNLKNRFLQYVATQLYEKHGDDLSEAVVILPNYNLSQILHNELMQISGRAMWMPKIFTLNGFVQSISTLRQVSSLELLANLNEVYNSVSNQKFSFNDFYFLGKKILNDFKYLDREGISIETIDNHNYCRENILSQSNFLNSYTEFNLHLREKKIGYRELCFKDVIDSLSKDDFVLPYQKIAAIGLTSLDFLEKSLILSLSKKCDIDFFDEGTDNKDFCNSIEILECQTRSSQVQIIASKIQELIKHSERSSSEEKYKIAIILSDFDLLLPLIAALPFEISDLSIDARYSTYFTNVYVCIKNLANIYIDRERNLQGIIKLDLIEKLLENSIFQSISNINSILSRIKKSNNTYLLIKESFDNDSDIYKLLNFDESDDLLEYLLRSLVIIRSFICSSPTSDLEKKILENIEFKFSELHKNKILKCDSQSSYAIIEDVLKSIHIPIKLNSNGFIYIASLDKVECLDYDHIFVLDAVEGNYPQKRQNLSFIVDDRDGISEKQELKEKYLFYRLLYNAKNLYFLYDSTSSEMSRYLWQFYYKYPQIVKKETISMEVKLYESIDIGIEKDDNIFEELQKFNVEKHNTPSILTPSAINTYLDCSLKFYFKHLKCIKDEIPRESIAIKAMFGTVLHSIMEHIYKPFVDKNLKKHIEKEDIDSILKNLDLAIDRVFDNVFLKNIPNEIGLEGYNILGKEIMQKCIKKILLLDREYAPFIIVGIEEGREEPLFIDHKVGSDYTIRLGGVIDRIDFKDAVFRVVDYKTGMHENKIKNIFSVFDSNYKSRNSIALQLFLYSWILYKIGQTHASKISPCIINTRQIFSQKPDLNILKKEEKGYEPILDLKDHMDIISTQLDKLLQELFDKNIPFVQTDNNNTCSMCEYKNICKKF